VDLQSKERPFTYHYVFLAAHPSLTGAGTPNAPIAEFQRPDNLALDREGNVAITEDPGGSLPSKTRGDDIWIAAPPEEGDGQHASASTVQRSPRSRTASPSPRACTSPAGNGGVLRGDAVGRRRDG
jgi:hypothetical protein